MMCSEMLHQSVAELSASTSELEKKIELMDDDSK